MLPLALLVVSLAIILSAAELFTNAIEWIGLKLCTLLVRFIEEEMVPVATRVAEMGIDPTPIMETVAGVLRVFADNLGPPQPEDD